MNWIEVSIDADGEAAEAVADLLAQYGYQGVVIEQLGFISDTWEDEVPAPGQLRIRAYLPDDSEAPALKAKLEDGLRYLARIYPFPWQPTYGSVREEDWAEAWKVHYKPLRIGKRIYIRPEWIEETPAEGEIEIVLDPGVAFGTGTHPSTQLCLMCLEDHSPAPAEVLDLGCGSGILGIAAVKLGAVHVHGVDTDAMAVRSTMENAALNSVTDRITATRGSLSDVLASGNKYGLILVNILAKVIIPMCEEGLGDVVEPGGIAIFSGIIDEQAEDVEAALRGTGLIPFKRRIMGDWVGIEARREA